MCSTIRAHLPQSEEASEDDGVDDESEAGGEVECDEAVGDEGEARRHHHAQEGVVGEGHLHESTSNADEGAAVCVPVEPTCTATFDHVRGPTVCKASGEGWGQSGRLTGFLSQLVI